MTTNHAIVEKGYVAKALFHRLVASFGRWGRSVGPASPPCLFLRGVPEWREDDRARWLTFLNSETGKRFLLRAHAVLFENALQGCKDSITTTHSAGKAAGFAEAIEWMQSLSRSASDKAENDAQTPEGEPSLRELLAP